MGSNQQFSLRWNNYVSHITGAFDTLRSAEELVDVTLSCEGKRIRAHKMLLSVCSTYFRDLFKENPCQHPVIIFRNVKFDDLVALIDFMYHGEVNVMQEQLTSFLTTAELLAIQGLSESGGKQNNAEPDNEVDLTDSPPPPPVQRLEPQTNSTGRLSQPVRQRKVSPPAPATFFERRPDSPPGKRRRWSSGVQPSPKPLPRRVEEEVAAAASPPPPRSPAQRAARVPTPEAPPPPPPPPPPLQPSSVKVELPEFSEEDRPHDEQEVSLGGDEDSLLPTKTEMQMSPSGPSTPDLSDLYGSSSRDAGATSDSLSAAELSQILSKPGPSGETQSQDSLQDTLLMLMKTVPRPVGCDLCGKSFKCHESLLKHRKVHTGDTTCPSCLKVFSTVYNMREHIRNIHREQYLKSTLN